MPPLEAKKFRVFFKYFIQDNKIFSPFSALLNILCFQGVPVFLEEGDYKETETFNIIEYPKSIKVVKEDMGTPELFLASSSNYEGNKAHLKHILKFNRRRKM